MRYVRWLGTVFVAVIVVGLLVQRNTVSRASVSETVVTAPALVLLEGAPEGTVTQVVMREPAGAGRAVVLGSVSHVAGSARRGAVLSRDGSLSVLVVVAERESRHASTYNSALFRVERGSVTRLVGEVTDASAPLVTERGTVLVQRGRDGADPPVDEHHKVLRERTDDLTLDAVDVSTGAVRTVWSGRGQIAFLAAALRGDDVLVYHVDDGGGHLFVLDAATGSVRPLVSSLLPLARDFSYQRDRDELVYARAAAYGSQEYEIVRMSVYGAGSPQVVYRAQNDHLMPCVLSDGTIALSLPGDRGLGWLDRSGRVRRVAPLGDGSDAVLAESPDRAWLVVRHTEPQREMLGLLYRPTGRANLTLLRSDTVVQFVGFVMGSVR